MRLVRKEIFEERSASARGQFLRAAFENMVGGATKHTTAETHRVTALEVSEWISRKVRRKGRSSRLVALHCLMAVMREDVALKTMVQMLAKLER